MDQTTSLFSQLLRVISRSEFQALVIKHGAERHAKGFSSWTQFVAMLFSQFARAESLREICNGLSCCEGKLVHLGVGVAPNKSTLSYANEHRPAELFEDLFWSLSNRFRAENRLGRPRTFRFKNKLLSFDSTTIPLCLALFPWARFRRAKGGVKAHVLLDHSDYMPAFVSITEAKQHDLGQAYTMPLNPGSIVALDKAYIDYELFGHWNANGIFFVTRMKENAVYEILQERDLPKNKNILRDQIIQLTGPVVQGKYPGPLRRVEVWDEENERVIVLLTNHLEFGSTTISFIYKDRWKIEIFFKTLKQNLKIKTFVGTSENALRIQIWTALISLLLFKWLHHLSKAVWSLSTFTAMLRMNLFTYRSLGDWLKDPRRTPPIEPPQYSLPLAGFGQALGQTG